MMPFLPRLIAKLEEQIQTENNERIREHLPILPRLKITLLGQIALMVQDTRGIPVAATADFDAWVPGEWESKRIFLDTLRSFGLQYDKLSREIWMPEEAKPYVVHESPLLLIETFRPIDIFVSKAVKAPEKNKFLLRHALAVFGEELEKRLEQHGVAASDFLR